MSPLTVIFWLLSAVVCGSVAYCGIAAFGAVRFLRLRRSSQHRGFEPPVSLLKPLYGADRELEQNLRSFFTLDYPRYEVLFSVREESDPAVAIVRRLQQEFPHVPSRLLIIGQPKFLNAKVHALEMMAQAARNDLFVITDSDVRVSCEYLREVVAPLQDPDVGLVTCLSRGVPGRTVWSILETLGMNTQFIPGVLSAWVLIGIEFSLGPTMAVARREVEAMGGFGVLGDYLADDFVLGERVAGLGKRVTLSANVPAHLVFNDSFRHSLRHRLRWERSSRLSRPAGYFGQIFMHTLPLAAAMCAAAPAGSVLGAVLFAIAVAARYLVAWLSASALGDKTFAKYFWLLPVQDAMSFLIWLWAFFGTEIEWRGARFRVLRGGKLERASPASS